MNKTDAETLYIFIKNEKRYYYRKQNCDVRVVNLHKLYSENNIKHAPSFFAEVYIPLIQIMIFTFLDDQKELKDPYRFPSKTTMLEAAKILANEAITEWDTANK